MQFGIPANSQVFAGFVIDAGFDGIVYPSTRGEGNCVAVFPQNFPDRDSSVELLDPAPSAECHQSLNCDSLNELMR